MYLFVGEVATHCGDCSLCFFFFVLSFLFLARQYLAKIKHNYARKNWDSKPRRADRQDPRKNEIVWMSECLVVGYSPRFSFLNFCTFFCGPCKNGTKRKPKWATADRQRQRRRRQHDDDDRRRGNSKTKLQQKKNASRKKQKTTNEQKRLKRSDRKRNILRMQSSYDLCMITTKVVHYNMILSHLFLEMRSRLLRARGFHVLFTWRIQVNK